MDAKTLAQYILDTPTIQDEALLKLATQGIIDYFASSLHAKQAPEIQSLLCWFTKEGGNQSCALIGQNKKATPRQSALFNGFQAHFLDYDDVQEQVRGHPSAVILSALLASLNTNQNIDGKRFLTAYIIGIEVMARFGEVMNPKHYHQGWHATSTLGVIASVASICYLHQYDFLDQAFALAATQSAGLRVLFGSPIKPLHAGLAAQSAIQSIELLQCGICADVDFLREDLGFMAVYSSQQSQINITNWGNTWRIQTEGLWFKTYPFCSAAATIADAAKVLQKQLENLPQLRLQDIDEVLLTFNPQGDTALLYKQITDCSQGRFSAEYIVAKILLNEPLDFQAFYPQTVSNSIEHLMAKMRRVYQDSSKRFGEVSIKFKNVKCKNTVILRQRIDNPKGSPNNPYSEQELYTKLEQAMDNPTQARNFFYTVQALKRDEKCGVNFQQFIQQYENL